MKDKFDVLFQKSERDQTVLKIELFNGVKIVSDVIRYDGATILVRNHCLYGNKIDNPVIRRSAIVGLIPFDVKYFEPAYARARRRRIAADNALS